LTTANKLNDASIVAAYARWAPVYDAIFGVITGPAIRATMAHLNNLPPSSILENGVGTGIALPLYGRHHTITGIDLSPNMLARAQTRAADQRLENVAGLTVMDALDLKFGDATFDAAVAMFVMSVVPDVDKALDEMIRVVKPGGRIVITNHFSAERGVLGAFERWLSRYATVLGWNPEFDIAPVTGRADLKMVETRSLSPFGIYTLLVFERV